MNAQNCLDILREIKDVAFATVNDEGKPEVRIIDVMIVGQDKLYFCTGRGKDFYRQLIEHPDVAVYPGESRYILEPFCISSGELEFFDLGKSPIYRESFVFGSAEASREATQNTGKESQICHAPREKGFLITDVCIGCGKCMRGCPQQCIAKGTPFLIHQENCLHCGLCFENCPVQAIVRRGA